MLHDAARLAALDAAAVLDTPPEADFDRLSALAREALRASAGFVVLVGADRQFVKACATDGPNPAGLSHPLSHSLCQHALSDVVVIPDTRGDPAWADHLAVRELGIGAYLGVPITVGGGHVLGTVCATEPGPRAWTDHDVVILRGVAAAAAAALDLRAAARRLAEREAALVAVSREREAALVAVSREREAVFAAMHDVMFVLDREGTYVRVLPTAPELLYRPSAEVLGRRMHEVLPPAEAGACLAVVREALAAARPVAHDYVLAIPDAAGGPPRETHFHAVASPLDPDAGTVLWVARDVTAERVAAAERRAAEARLRAREATLDVIYNGATDLMFLMAVEDAPNAARAYRCASVNAAYHAATGLTDALLVGRTLEEIVPADHAVFLRAHYDAAVDGGTVLRYEERVPLDGTEVHVETTLTPVRDGDGRTTHLLGVARDVTARRAAEEAVRASEGRLRAMSAATPVGVFEADLAGGLRYVNPRACEIWALPEAAMLGDGWHERVHVHDLPDLLADWRAASEAGEEFARVYRLLLPAGRGAPTVRWVHGRSAPLRDEQGRVTGCVGTLEDVTERHTAETTQRRLTSILEAMPDVVAVSTPSGRIEYLNAAGRRLLGVAGGAERVRDAGLLVTAVQPQFAAGGERAGALAAAMVEGRWAGETTLRKGDGREIPVEQVVLAHRSDEGDVEYLSSILRDVTERKQTEATLKALSLVDDLTGLYNRRGFLALAEREWEAARAGGQGAVLCYLDLDGFKGVNDTHGHAEGDRALQAMAAVLRQAFRDADVVGRLGGDEFVAFARCGQGPSGAGGALENARATAARLQTRLHAALAESNLAAGRPYTLATSVGVALFDPAQATTLSALMVEADAALYDRKRARKRAA